MTLTAALILTQKKNSSHELATAREELNSKGSNAAGWREAPEMTEGHEATLIKEAGTAWRSLGAPDRSDGDHGKDGVDDFEDDKRCKVHVVSFPSFEAFVVSART